MIKKTAILIYEIAKYNSEISQLILNAGGVTDLIKFLGNTRGHIRLPGIMALGNIASHSESLAMAVIVKWVSLKINLNFDNTILKKCAIGMSFMFYFN